VLRSDLKPANIMLSKGVVKIGDFGFAKKKVVVHGCDRARLVATAHCYLLEVNERSDTLPLNGLLLLHVGL
jgi:serine/threonine protein kinase